MSITGWHLFGGVALLYNNRVSTNFIMELLKTLVFVLALFTTYNIIYIDFSFSLPEDERTPTGFAVIVACILWSIFYYLN